MTTPFQQIIDSPFHHYRDRWNVGPYEIFQVEEKYKHNADRLPGTLYMFAIDGKLHNRCYLSLDSAMAEAIAARHCGTQGAAGTAVDTAAGWFIRMLDSYESDVENR